MKLKYVVKKHIYDRNPLSIHRCNKMRKRLLNKDISFLCPNCAGGTLFHDLNLQFKSPTMNTMFFQYDFIKFVKRLDDYLQGEMEFYDDPEYSFPCAYLYTKQKDEKIVIHFTHYDNNEQALEKWNIRKKRINKENLFVCLQERDGITYEDIKSLNSINVKGLVVFTAHKYDDLPYTVFIPSEEKYGEVTHFLERTILTNKKCYETYFDFVGWFNEADGFDYSVDNFNLLKK